MCDEADPTGPPRYLLLGPAGVRVGSDLHLLRGRRQILVFTLLVLQAGVPVAAEDLLEEVWEDGLPADPVGALQSQVSRLRALLGGSLAGGDGTYMLAAHATDVDMYRFEALVRESRQLLDGGASALARRRVEQALVLWRGTPFPAMAGKDVVETEAARVHELRLEALVVRTQADLTLGRTASAVISLRALTAGYPLREDLWALLVRALYVAGRTAEALDAYRTARRTLASELGLEPGPHLRGLEAAVLRRDPELAGAVHPCSAHAQLLGATPRPCPRLGVPEPAAQAFVDRVRFSLPGYDPGPAECSDIVRLVEALQGDPMRIELAAAQLPHRTVGQLLAMHRRGLRERTPDSD